MPVMSLRLSDEEMSRINDASAEEHREKSAVARELLDAGWTHRWLMRYHEGRASLETVAARLGVSVSEVLDLLADLGIEAPLRYDDYLQAFEHVAEARE